MATRRRRVTGYVVPVMRQWNSLSEAIAAVDAPSKHGNTERASRRDGKSYADFAGTANWNEAKELATNGWMEVRPQIDAAIDSVRDQLRHSGTLRPVFRFDVSGGEVMVPRYLECEPECMREAFLVPSLGRTVKIAIQTTTSGAVSTKQILARGAAVLGLVEVLALMNIGCEVWAINSISGWDGGIKLREASDPMDLNTIAFAIAHPSMQRRVFFGLQEQEPNWRAMGCHNAGGYGGVGYYSGTTSPEYLAEMQFDVHVGSGGIGERGLVGDIDGNPAAWIKKTVEGLGLTING